MKNRLLFLLLIFVAVMVLLGMYRDATDRLMRMQIAEAKEAAKLVPRSKNPSKDEIVKLILDTAARHQINQTEYLETIRCESQFRSIQSEIINASGVREESYGITQIHLPDHPDVTKEQALDPYFAVEWSAPKFKKDPTIWTCYRNLYGNNPRTEGAVAQANS